MWDRLPRQRAGRAISARTINAIVNAATKGSKITAAPPLAIQDSPGGPVLSLQLVTPFPAFIHGSTSPYTFEEAYETPTGGWAVRTGGRTGSVYEVNGVPGLGT